MSDHNPIPASGARRRPRVAATHAVTGCRRRRVVGRPGDGMLLARRGMLAARVWRSPLPTPFDGRLPGQRLPRYTLRARPPGRSA